MKLLDISSDWIQALGWTLIHSLWQAPLIFLLLFLFLKSTRHSKLRYGASALSLTAILMCAFATFLLIRPQPAGSSESVAFIVTALDLMNVKMPEPTSFAQQAVLYLDENIVWITRIWLLGTVFFIMRLAAGFYFIERIRRNATPVPEMWMQRIQQLAVQLNVKRTVQFAEANIDSPVVIGFIKPIVLFPIGLLAGLSNAQVEAILIHELSHIQRHDFLVNIFQSIMEALFFFNPFVWIISSRLRQEREHCCDDRVLAAGASPIVYVKTLAALEEARLPINMAIGFSADKNLLLERIKRIMEKSVTKNSERGRFLPIALLLLGLACMSWLTIQRTAPEEETNNPDQEVIASDTVVKEKSRKSATKVESRSVTRWDENGVPHETIEEVYEGDSDSWDEADWNAPFAIEIPDMPEMAAVPDFLTEMPVLAGFPPFDEQSGFDLHFDSLPNKTHFRFNEDEWEAFEEEFKTKFKDFWEKNHVELETMMEQAREKAYAYEAMKFDENRAMEMAMLGNKMAALAPSTHDLKAFEDDMKRAEKEMKYFDLDMRKMEGDLKKMERDMKFFETDMKELEKNTQAFETELRDELIKDGYLKKDEKLSNLRFSDEGMWVNDKKVKDADRDRYKAIKRKYFKGSGYHRVE